MGNMKISEDQYLGKQELNRLVKLLSDDGFKALLKAFIVNYGVSLFKNDSLQVIAGTGSNITVVSGKALNNNMELIDVLSNQVDVLAIPADNILRLIVISYKKRTKEIGTVNIATDGTLTGVGTEFTKVLRGEYSNPVIIRFPDSPNNIGDYPLLEVNGDLSATLNTAVALIAETNQKYEVVGSFTPNQVIAPSQKIIYEYDDFEINLRLGTPFSGEFVLASVQNDGVSLNITDLRTNNLLQII